jgi:hypothetical protein
MMRGRVILTPNGPYSLPLSWRAASRFSPDNSEVPGVFREAVRLGLAVFYMMVYDRLHFVRREKS